MLVAPKITNALSVLGLSFGQFESMSNEQLHKFRRDLIKTCHPDLPENRCRETDLGAINAAYDYLKSLGSTSFTSAVRSAIAPPWQPDKRTTNNTIRVESYRDVNYIKKRCWELSGHSDDIYMLDAFGKTSFEGRTMVYGSPAIFEEMARAILIWNANGGKLTATRAVFVSSLNDEHSLNLIYADGRSFAKRPIQMRFDPAAGTQYNDKTFQNKLPAILDKVGEMFAAEPVVANLSEPIVGVHCEITR